MQPCAPPNAVRTACSPTVLRSSRTNSNVVVTLVLVLVALLLLTGESPSELVYGREQPTLNLVGTAPAAGTSAAPPDPQYQTHSAATEQAAAAGTPPGQAAAPAVAPVLMLPLPSMTPEEVDAIGRARVELISAVVQLLQPGEPCNGSQRPLAFRCGTTLNSVPSFRILKSLWNRSRR